LLIDGASLTRLVGVGYVVEQTFDDMARLAQLAKFLGVARGGGDSGRSRGRLTRQS